MTADGFADARTALRDIRADRLAYGTSSWATTKNTFTRWLMGSVSEQVVFYANCTVTVVR